MTSRNILVSGAGPAGLAFALLAAGNGDHVHVVERAPAPRSSGYAVDLRGDALDVADRLGVLDDLRRAATGMGDVRVLGADGTVESVLPAERFGGDLEVPKPTLTALLAARADREVTVSYGDSLTSLADRGDHVGVTFEHATPTEVDLVVGADGVWSRTRRLVFGDHERYLHHLGMSGVGFTTHNWLDLDHEGVLRPGPGATVYAFSGRDRSRMTVSLSFGTSSAALDRGTRAEQEDAVRAAFAAAGWEVPRLLVDMARADDLYFASTGQVVMDRWSRGRVALLGDAACCAAPTSGMGTSQALLGACALADALHEHDDHATAFADYERRLRPLVAANQRLGEEAAREFGAPGRDSPSGWPAA